MNITRKQLRNIIREEVEMTPRERRKQAKRQAKQAKQAKQAEQAKRQKQAERQAGHGGALPVKSDSNVHTYLQKIEMEVKRMRSLVAKKGQEQSVSKEMKRLSQSLVGLKKTLDRLGVKVK